MSFVGYLWVIMSMKVGTRIVREVALHYKIDIIDLYDILKLL